MKANVLGYSLEPEDNSLFSMIKESNFACKNVFNDILNKEKLNKIINEFKPEIIFHLAAQPLVIDSYKNPQKTWETNLLGTLNLLEANRNVNHKCIIIVITTDKVYKIKDFQNPFKEEDPLGGNDPYSASKASAELLVNSWRTSFCGKNPNQNPNLYIATARSGNVIGGGDWGENRIVPDCIKHLLRQEKILIRNPNSVRPWQHVLDCLGGYLILSEKLFINKKYSQAFNFGPKKENLKNVEDLVNEILKNWEGSWDYHKIKDSYPETKILSLDIKKSTEYLEWMPIWSFSYTVKKTINWYKKILLKKENSLKVCLEDINDYEESYSKFKKYD